MQDERKQQAILLRRQGQTYSEIAKSVPVSKATLSGWLSSIPVPDSYYRKLVLLKRRAREKGWEARRRERIERTAQIVTEAAIEAERFKHDPLWLVGLTLYWAEGSKEKSWGKGVLVTFTNMDVDTVHIFKTWCEKFLKAGQEDFSYSVYIHDTQKSNSDTYAQWWADRLSIPSTRVAVYYKHSKIAHVRRNDGSGYRGVFRLQIRRSVDLNRRISGWISGMIRSLEDQ